MTSTFSPNEYNDVDTTAFLGSVVYLFAGSVRLNMYNSSSICYLKYLGILPEVFYWPYPCWWLWRQIFFEVAFFSDTRFVQKPLGILKFGPYAPEMR